MNKLNIKLIGVNSKGLPDVFADGLSVKCSKNNFGSLDAEVQTEKNEVEIEIIKEPELKGKFWWLYAIISFVLSIFGIFEPPYDKKCIALNCKFRIKLCNTGLKNINAVKLKFNTNSSQGRAAEIETENEFEEITNQYSVDQTVKKRRKIVILGRIIAWICIIFITVYFIVKSR